VALERVVALAGGVGGAKLADGLARILPPGGLHVIVNIGDDFEHYGLHIAPDLDTVMYTLAGIANPETGWGLGGESWQTLGMLQKYGQTPWFRLGDQDFATHILRTHALRQGQTLTALTQTLCAALGLQQTILPASDDRVPTRVDTLEYGTLPFQEYFVRQRWQPTVQRVWYDGIKEAKPTAQVITALDQADAIVICPSNPILSIDPILALGDLRERLAQRRVPCVAVSPLISGRAVKGPAQKILVELGMQSSTQGLMDFYRGLIDGLVVEHGDALAQGTFLETKILMESRLDREHLAQQVLSWVKRLQ
jgi:LPPG:FO 2-phospho-L-lactate transferase